MMESLRGAATGWVAKVLIGLLAASFGIWGINDVFTGYRSDSLATVGDYEIPADSFRFTLEQRLRDISRQTGQPITNQRAAELGLDRQVLGEMLRNGALQQQASEMKLAVPDALVAHELATESMFQDSRGQFDANRFRQILRQNGLTEQMFLREEKAGKLRQALAEPVSNKITPPETLVEAIVRHAREERDAKYFVLAPNQAEVAEPSESELKTFYDRNPQLFTAPAYRSLVLLKVDPKDLTANISLTEEEIAAAYEKHKDEFRTPERREVQQLTFATIEEARAAKQRIDQGADFLTIAKEKGIAESDLNLGLLARNEIPDKLISDAAFALKEGQVSEPVEGRLAKAILKVTKITPEVVKPLAEVRDDLSNKLKLERAHDDILTQHGKIEDERAAGSNFESISKTLGVALINVPAIDPQGRDKSGKPVENIPAKAEVIQLAFESDVGVETDPIPTKDDGYVWVEVRDAKPEAVRPFAEVKTEVNKAYVSQKLREQVLKKAAELVKRAENGTTLEALAQEVGAEVKTETGLTRNKSTQTFDSAAVSALFLAPDNGYVYAPEIDGRGVKILQALPLKAPPYDPKSKEAEAVRKALREGLGNDLLATYVSAIQKSLGVTINDRLWQQATGASQ
jgi:peptidyl-prolyl cis-trans isomerase D